MDLLTDCDFGSHRRSILRWSCCDLCLHFLRLPIDGCIGRRFFQSPAHISLLKDMKKRLTEVADFHHAASKALRVPAEGSEGPPVSQAGTPAYLTSPELHTELVRWGIGCFAIYICSTGTVLDPWFLLQTDKCSSLNLFNWIWKVVLTVGLHFVMFLFYVAYEKWIGCTSVKCLESEQTQLNQRAGVLFSFFFFFLNLITEANQNDWS